MNRTLSITERSVVLSLAKSAVYEFLTRRRELSCPRHDFLKIPSAAFVTLRLAGELRGCIGSTQSHYPLGQTVIRCAISAATEDPRFPALTIDEFPNVAFEVSILSEFTQIQSIQAIEPGVHGVMITCGYARGLLLPQVATDHRWDRETFFRHVCYKAGLLNDNWPTDDNARVEIFTAEIFGDPELH